MTLNNALQNIRYQINLSTSSNHIPHSQLLSKLEICPHSSIIALQVRFLPSLGIWIGSTSRRVSDPTAAATINVARKLAEYAAMT